MPKLNCVFVLKLLKDSQSRIARYVVLLIYSLFCTQTTSIQAIMDIAVSDQPSNRHWLQTIDSHRTENVNTKHEKMKRP